MMCWEKQFVCFALRFSSLSKPSPSLSLHITLTVFSLVIARAAPNVKRMAEVRRRWGDRASGARF